MVLFLGNRLEGGTILDIGAGFITPAGGGKELRGDVKIIGLDVSHTSLRRNPDVDYRLVADACMQWPLADSSVDMIISRSVIEHLEDTRAFASECRRVLKPGGYSVHLLPGRNAPFSLLNRLLPRAVSRRLLDWAFPEKKDELGYPAFYNDCAFPDIEHLFEDQDLSIEITHFRYYQSTYYVACFPIYLLSVLYDLMIWKLGVKRLSSQLLVVAYLPIG